MVHDVPKRLVALLVQSHLVVHVVGEYRASKLLLDLVDTEALHVQLSHPPLLFVLYQAFLHESLLELNSQLVGLVDLVQVLQLLRFVRVV